MPQKNRKTPITEPGSPSPESNNRWSVRAFTSQGCEPAVARWLVQLLARALPPAAPTVDAVEPSADPRIDALASVWCLQTLLIEGDGSELEALACSRVPSTASTRDTGLLATLAILVGDFYAPRIDRAIEDEAAVAVAREMVAHGADFRALLLAGWPPYLVENLLGSPFDPARAREKHVCSILVRAGAIDQQLADALTAPYPSGFLTETTTKSVGRTRSQEPSPETLAALADQLFSREFDFYLSRFRDPELRDVARRIVYGTPDDLREFRAMAAECPADRFVAVVGTIADAAATRWANSEGLRRFDIYDGHSPEWRDRLRAFGCEMRVYFELADARVPQNPSAASPALRTLWMLLFRMAWDVDRAACPEKTRKRMIDAARADIAALRQVLEKADKAGDTPEAQQFVLQLRHLRRCASLLAFHGSVFQMLKPMVLALRKLKTPAVAHDLRDWDEFADDPPPKPWCELPAMISAVFHATVGREQVEDPDLENLRGEFGAFCLERLTDRWKDAERKAAPASGRVRTNEDMTEPSPEWRYAYVRAAAALRINPDGKGHRTLHMAASLDPDGDVKDAARSAEQLLRHQGRLPERVSPRRAVMTAIWLLKQAHLRALDVYVDADGAQRTRIKELTRTKEVERADD
jgi:hypothetical protein